MKLGHVTGTKREKHGTPMFYRTAAQRLAAWAAKQAAERAVQAPVSK